MRCPRLVADVIHSNFKKLIVKWITVSSVVVLLHCQGASHPIPNALPDLLHFSMLESANPIWSVVKLIDTEMQGI